MPQLHLPSDNLRSKDRLIRDPNLKAKPLGHHLHLTIHQIPFCFHFDNEEVVRELYDSYPLAWFSGEPKNATHVYWYDSRTLGFSDHDWEEESTYECYVDRQGPVETAVHRDFAAAFDGSQCVLVCPYSVQDGFYNFLRWFVPIHFLGQNKLLLHSSCVLDQNKNAYFSLGFSGAGKTTIASLRPRRKILGDDMNVIKIENGQVWAQAGALGQALLNPAEYSNWYPVKALFWLKKSPHFEITNMSAARQVQCLATAVANLFWTNLTEQQSLTVFNDINSILKITKMYELAFPIERSVWDRVFQSFKEET